MSPTTTTTSGTTSAASGSKAVITRRSAPHGSRPRAEELVRAADAELGEEHAARRGVVVPPAVDQSLRLDLQRRLLQDRRQRTGSRTARRPVRAQALDLRGRPEPSLPPRAALL